MIKVRTRLVTRPLNLDFTDELQEIAEKVIIPDIQGGINRSVGIDNVPFPPLEPSTIERKQGQRKSNNRDRQSIKKATGILIKSAFRGAGGGTKPLVDTGKLLGSFNSRKVSKNKIEISIASDREAIGGYLQVDGVGKKKKKFNFFGVSQRAEIQAISFIQRKLKDILDKANGKS